MEQDYYNKDKSFSYKAFGYSCILIAIILMGLSVFNFNKGKETPTKTPTTVAPERHIETLKYVVDSTWIEFPNSVTQTTPRYCGRFKNGITFCVNMNKYQKGDTVEISFVSEKVLK